METRIEADTPNLTWDTRGKGSGRADFGKGKAVSSASRVTVGPRSDALLLFHHVPTTGENGKWSYVRDSTVMETGHSSGAYCFCLWQKSLPAQTAKSVPCLTVSSLRHRDHPGRGHTNPRLCHSLLTGRPSPILASFSVTNMPARVTLLEPKSDHVTESSDENPPVVSRFNTGTSKVFSSTRKTPRSLPSGS